MADNFIPDEQISDVETQNAFYRSYGEGSDEGLNPALRRNPQLIDPAIEDRRPLTLGEEDAQFRECWLETRRLLREERGEAVAQAGGPVLAPVVACEPALIITDRPAYEPALWNDAIGELAGPVQHSTNCYAYAMNSRLGHPPLDKPQPGEFSLTDFNDPVDCASTSLAVISDGEEGEGIVVAYQCPYNKEKKLPPREKPGYYLVALVATSKPTGYDAAEDVAYQNDYHWYRQDLDGTWSHKPGWAEATQLDSEGNPILNPETAGKRYVTQAKYIMPSENNRPIDEVTDYDMFCGYFYVRKGGAWVGPLPVPEQPPPPVPAAP